MSGNNDGWSFNRFDEYEAKLSGEQQQEEVTEEVEQIDEGIDFKGAKRIDDARAKAQAEKDKKNPSGKDRRLAMGKFRPGASNEERAEGHRDNMREKGTSPIKNGKKMFEDLQATGLFTVEEIEALVEAACGDRAYPSGQKLQKGGEVKDCEKCKGKGCDHCEGKGTHKKEEVKEAAKPDFLDKDGDGDKEEPMKKALKEKGKKKEDKEEDKEDKEEVKEDLDPMVEAAVAALAPLLAKGAGAAKAAGAAAKGAGAAAKGSKLGAMAKGAAKDAAADAAMDLGTSAVKGITSIPGKIGNAISDAAKKTVSSEDEE